MDRGTVRRRATVVQYFGPPPLPTPALTPPTHQPLTLDLLHRVLALHGRFGHLLDVSHLVAREEPGAREAQNPVPARER